ncbi:MAG: ABC transporter substrate-binding protein [Clostridia bacterium]|nr:ABC transporter substrate-binding protein [Clostridia bacterium]
MKKIVLFVLIMVMLITIGTTGCNSSSKVTLNVYNWGEYIDKDTIKMFEKEFDIKVNYKTFTTNEDMYVKITSGNAKYDVLFPSDYMIERLIEEDLLYKLNMENIPNSKFIADEFTSPLYDPSNEYSVPYMWGTVGILYNKKMVTDVVDSWDILWNEKYSQQILMQDSQRDSLMVGLLKLGYSMNTTSEDEINQAKQLLIDQRPLVLGYVVDEVRDKMVNEEAALAVVWSGEAMIAKAENPDLEYVIPKEGSNIWVDAMVIPENSENKEAAELFINFMTRTDIALMNAEWVGYNTPQTQAYIQLEPDVKNDKSAYPDQSVIDTLEFFVYDKKATELFNKAWTEIIAD